MYYFVVFEQLLYRAVHICALFIYAVRLFAQGIDLTDLKLTNQMVSSYNGLSHSV